MIEEIVKRAKAEVAVRKSKIPADFFKLDGKTRSLRNAINEAPGNAIIAEIKPASPSEGRIRDVNVEETARALERGGACALSVLTEPFYFYGSLENLKITKETTKLPVMRKDFIVDEYQLLEAKHYGADAVLLMVSVLGEETKKFCEKSKELGMESVVEVHTAAEVPTALASGADIIGINNRNLKDLSIDLNTTAELSALIPEEKIVISESGVKSAADLEFVLKYTDAALVGTSLMKSADAEAVLRSLVDYKGVEEK